jgi:integrase
LTPFRAKDRKVWKTRITLEDGRTGIFSCGTDDLATARQVVNCVKTLKRRRRWDALGLVVEKRITLGRLFDAFELGTLDSLIKEMHDPDLSALVEQWPTNSDYRMQVRRMIPKGQHYPASRFSRRTVSEFLAGLNQTPRRKGEPVREMSGSTKNRYRAALSVFARWLVEREVIEVNPVRDVRAQTPNPARMVWLTREQAKKLIEALPREHAAMEALMAATGMELQAVQRLRRRDVSTDLKTARAEGSKTPWRNRVVMATEPWAWTIVERYVATILPDALCFTARGDTVLKVHRRLSKELGLPVTTLHDWRHSYAVWCLKDGVSPTAIARQLGHKDTSLLEKVYGRFIPEPTDYLPRKSTHSATREKQAPNKGKRA